MNGLTQTSYLKRHGPKIANIFGITKSTRNELRQTKNKAFLTEANWQKIVTRYFSL